MRPLRFLLAPPLLVLIGAFIYALTSVAPDARVRIFAILSMTGFGATELVAVSRLLISGRWSRLEVGARLLNAIGASLVGLSGLADTWGMPFVAGGITLTAGLLLWQRALLRSSH